MKTETKIAITSTIALSLGVLLWVGKPKSKKEQKSTKDDDLVKKTYGEDTFMSITNDRIKFTLQPSYKRFYKGYQKDLKQYGTEQGVIDVSNDAKEKKKKKKLIKGMEKVGAALVYKNLPKLAKNKIQPFTKKIDFYGNLYSHLNKDFGKTQVVIKNDSVNEKLIRLWGANNPISVSPSDPANVNDHIITTTLSSAAGVGVHPQGVAYNPKNNFIYVANQLSNSVTVIDSANLVVKTIQLLPALAGVVSPVAIAIDPTTGFAYVTGSVSDKVYVIDFSLNVLTEIAVGKRPIGITFNSFNNRIYTADFVDDTITVIDPSTNTVDTFFVSTGINPFAIAIHPSTGNIYVTSKADDTVGVYDTTGLSLAVIDLNGFPPISADTPIAIIHQTSSDDMLVVCEMTNNVLIIDTSSFDVTAEILTGNQPKNIFFNSDNNYFYILNSADETLTVIDSTNNIISTIGGLGEQNIGAIFNPNNGLIYISDTGQNAVNIIGLPAICSSITIDDDYDAKVQDFLHSPAIVQHVRFTSSTDERLRAFNTIYESIQGKQDIEPIVFGNYESPQNFLNVSEVHELAGFIIDGHNSWEFLLPAMQTVNILIYYKQFQIVNLIPKPLKT